LAQKRSALPYEHEADFEHMTEGLALGGVPIDS